MFNWFEMPSIGSFAYGQKVAFRLHADAISV